MSFSPIFDNVHDYAILGEDQINLEGTQINYFEYIPKQTKDFQLSKTRTSSVSTPPITFNKYQDIIQKKQYSFQGHQKMKIIQPLNIERIPQTLQLKFVKTQRINNNYAKASKPVQSLSKLSQFFSPKSEGKTQQTADVQEILNAFYKRGSMKKSILDVKSPQMIKISQESQIYDRSIDWLSKKKYRVGEQQLQINKQQLFECPFKPQINQKPRSISRQIINKKDDIEKGANLFQSVHVNKITKVQGKENTYAQIFRQHNTKKFP